ncbi:hypothetical protein C0995_007697 [Termitomyces sp. Mi166|nr:hypothetical protein C0995_007697 [Termitomyces sp. Mi166\
MKIQKRQRDIPEDNVPPAIEKLTSKVMFKSSGIRNTFDTGVLKFSEKKTQRFNPANGNSIAKGTHRKGNAHP